MYPGQPPVERDPYTSSVPVVPGRAEEPFTLASLTAPRTGPVPPSGSFTPYGYAPGMPVVAPGRPRGRRRPLLIVAVGLAVAVLAAGETIAYVAITNARDAQPALAANPTYSSLFGDQKTKPGTIIVAGTLTLITGGFVNTGSGCAGKGGYSDIRAGAQVVVTDSGGSTLGLGSLTTGKVESGGCVFAFAILDVPGGKGFYGVTVTHRGTIQYSESDVKNGVVSLSLGD